MRPVRITSWPLAMLDHQIMLMERRAVRWARIFKTSPVDFLPVKYAELVTERLTR